MKVRSALGLSMLVAVAGGCVVGSRPLTPVDDRPEAGSPPLPPPAVIQQDASVPTTDGGDAIPPAPGVACWSNQLPAQVQPMSPRLAVVDACAMGGAATAWSFPSNGVMSSTDARATIVGRWVACSATTSFPAGTHAGVEFGANGRWRLLAADASGALVPMTGDGATGYYYQLGSGQIDVTGEALTPIYIRFSSFAAGMDALRFTGEPTDPAGAIYARTQASPLNGNDNLPSISDGRCSLVGDWDLPANKNPPGAPAATFSFDAVGNFVGGSQGSDLCAAHTMYGTYQLLPGAFEITTNVGLGACAWWFDASFPATFSDDCSSITTMQHLDNCTGGRGYFNQTTTMTRRR